MLLEFRTSLAYNMFKQLCLAVLPVILVQNLLQLEQQKRFTSFLLPFTSGGWHSICFSPLPNTCNEYFTGVTQYSFMTGLYWRDSALVVRPVVSMKTKDQKRNSIC